MLHIFDRPLVVRIEKPTFGQVIWAVITMALMLDLIFAGFAPDWAASWYARLFGVSTGEMYSILKGVTFGSTLMLILFAIGSNQVSIPLAMVENHKPTAFVLAVLLVLVGVVLNKSAVSAFFDKLDMLYVLLIAVGIGLAYAAYKWWPKHVIS